MDGCTKHSMRSILRGSQSISGVQLPGACNVNTLRPEFSDLGPKCGILSMSRLRSISSVASSETLQPYHGVPVPYNLPWMVCLWIPLVSLSIYPKSYEMDFYVLGK